MAGDATKRLIFIDVARAAAALAVFYFHIEAHYLRKVYDGDTTATEVVATWAEEPLGLPYLGIGQIAVCLFFLVSGFVVTPIALKLGAGRFAVNRFFRVYPLLFVVMALSVVGFWLGVDVLTSPAEPVVNTESVLSNLTLVTFSVAPYAAFAGVAWTLAVEVIFYALLVLMLPLFRRWTWVAIAVELEIVLLALLLRGPLGDGYDGLASQAAYLVLPIVGQIIWAGWHGKLRGILVGAYLAAAWLLLVWAAAEKVDVYYALAPGPAAIAVLLFTMGLGLEHKLTGNKFWVAASERSYSLYLTHGLVGLPVMIALHDHVGVPIAIAAGLVATAVAVQVMYLTVERPSHQLGQRLSRKRPERPPALDLDAETKVIPRPVPPSRRAPLPPPRDQRPRPARHRRPPTPRSARR